MKALFLISLSLASTIALGQETPPAKSNVEVKTDQKQPSQATVTAPPKLPPPPPKFDGSRVKFGGFFVDLAKAEKPLKALDLRTPVKPYDDNLYTDPQSGKVRGFVLFSIKF